MCAGLHVCHHSQRPGQDRNEAAGSGWSHPGGVPQSGTDRILTSMSPSLFVAYGMPQIHVFNSFFLKLCVCVCRGFRM